MHDSSTMSFPSRPQARRLRGRMGLAVVVVAALVTAACAGSYTKPAVGITNTSANVEGLVFTTTNATITYWFDYGTTTVYGNKTPTRSLTINDRDTRPVSEPLTALTPGTTYNFRTCAKDVAVVCGNNRTFTTTGVAPLSITVDPALFPAFDPAVTDYVTRCGAPPVSVSVVAPAGTTVSVAGGAAQSGTFNQSVPMTPGIEFGFQTTVSGVTSSFYVRCLPANFPAFTYSRPGQPSANFYITTPQNVKTPNGQVAGKYAAIFDDRGVPVWWKSTVGAIDAKLLPDGNLAWGYFLTGGGAAGYDTFRLDGTLVKSWNTVGTPTDFHDIQQLPNGNMLIGSYSPRPGTMDLTPYGGPATNGTLTDAIIQEITPTGSVAWSWNSKDHIDPSETPQRWRPLFVYGLPATLPDGRQTFDYVHWNSLQQVGTSVVLSFRHTDSVYVVSKTDGAVLYKVGGTPTPESLTVVGDPEANPLGGQHFARVLPDGTMTVFDNNSFETAAPRAVRYHIDLFNRTATFLEQAVDPAVPDSPCCGSSTRLSDGSWVASWGGNPVISEQGPTGNPHFSLGFTSIDGGFGFSYRVDPVEGTGLTIGALRTGMNAMAPAP